MNEYERRWSAKDELILSGLAAGMTHDEAAAFASVSTKTIQRRLAEAEFAAEVVRRRTEHVERMTGRLTTLSDRAVDTIEAALEDDEAPIRLRAAHLTLNWMVKLRRGGDLERSIAEIERVLTSVLARRS